MTRLALSLKIGNLLSICSLLGLSVYFAVWDKQVVDEWFSRPNYFMPAEFTNIVIPIIYFLFILFVLTQFRPEFDELIVNGIEIWFTLANIFTIGWLVFLKFRWFYALEAAMLGILISVTKLYQNLSYYRFQDWLSYFTVYLPFTMFTAWTVTDTIATTFVVFFDLNQGDYEYSKYLSMGCIILLTLLGLYQSERKGHVAYGLVIGWSLFGIAIEQSWEYHLSIVGLICCGIVLGSVGRGCLHEIISRLRIGTSEERRRLL
ncbi:hypothetical protein K493DRAFT_313107 [Basidiobolus meristosporus CBS 931.73]|uniref:Uncharacterized protein n=1 Tax=Basidiobolus meristosporus CBS 931.73 TaxID=1314790 RepID=A0A1Y1YP30_9FUNG|nr:hypothetical protein K493DRAFT_313107 [Basidiobolus meristosporus CBS 931.73]|eukprot:ORX99725.1 hypothetical protein K493DRAFT_313107 [Basidiobolus meristosporus CBS 931.73]